MFYSRGIVMKAQNLGLNLKKQEGHPVIIVPVPHRNNPEVLPVLHWTLPSPPTDED